jgi:hypothetical protein
VSTYTNYKPSFNQKIKKDTHRLTHFDAGGINVKNSTICKDNYYDKEYDTPDISLFGT